MGWPLLRYPTPAVQSCATCRHWRVEGAKGRPWCPRAARWLPVGDLVLVACVLWARELHESDARELYERLINGN
jgi:hypothetical protein